MNWKRGLFRAWLVLSVLWTAVPAWNFYDLLKRRDLASKGLEVCFAAKQSNPALGNPFGCFDDLVPLGPQIANNVVIALGPPIALLLLGYVLLWILRGFRR